MSAPVYTIGLNGHLERPYSRQEIAVMTAPERPPPLVYQSQLLSFDIQPARGDMKEIQRYFDEQQATNGWSRPFAEVKTDSVNDLMRKFLTEQMELEKARREMAEAQEAIPFASVVRGQMERQQLVNQALLPYPPPMTSEAAAEAAADDDEVAAAPSRRRAGGAKNNSRFGDDSVAAGIRERARKRREEKKEEYLQRIRGAMAREEDIPVAKRIKERLDSNKGGVKAVDGRNRQDKDAQRARERAQKHFREKKDEALRKMRAAVAQEVEDAPWRESDVAMAAKPEKAKPSKRGAKNKAAFEKEALDAKHKSSAKKRSEAKKDAGLAARRAILMGAGAPGDE